MSDDKLDSGIIIQQLLLDSDNAVEEDFALLGQTAALGTWRSIAHMTLRQDPPDCSWRFSY